MSISFKSGIALLNKTQQESSYSFILNEVDVNL